MKHLLWLGMILVFALQPAIAQMEKGEKKEGKKSGNVEDQVKKMADEGREAALKGDASFLEKNATDDYEFITGTGAVLSRAEAIAARKSGDIKYSSIEASDPKVRVHGNTAIYTATTNVKGTLKGNDISGTYRLAQVWVKEGGSWKIANTQSTKMQAPGS
jgi:ketosteroid isomerase-like protein